MAIADALGPDSFDCTRVWSAWSYGTMGPNDFIETHQEPTEAMEEAFHNAMEVDFEVQRQRCLKEGIAWKSLFYIVWRAAISAAKETTR